VKLQFAILFFLVCLNLSVGLVLTLGLAGTEYVMAEAPNNQSGYSGHFNATEVADRWGSTPVSGIPVIGDIFSAFSFLFQNLQYLIDGFPQFMNWVGDTYLTDPSARLAFSYIANALRALYAVLMAVFAIEYVGGRYFTD